MEEIVRKNGKCFWCRIFKHLEENVGRIKIFPPVMERNFQGITGKGTYLNASWIPSGSFLLSIGPIDSAEKYTIKGSYDLILGSPASSHDREDINVSNYEWKV